MKHHFNIRKSTHLLTALFFTLVLVIFGLSVNKYSRSQAASSECTIGVGENSIPDGCTNQDVVIDGNTTVTTSGTRNFKSLKITNNGVLTHDPILVTDMSDQTNLKPTSAYKRVDLVIEGDLTLESGGSINVDGKGYPGGENKSGRDGYGPGRGKGFYEEAASDREPAAGGGGFGGKGGMGLGRQSFERAAGGPVNPVPFNSDSPDLQFGSGGGSATLSDGTGTAGGAGGGRIYLMINGNLSVDGVSGSTISANGTFAFCDNNTVSRRSCSGGGSGGMIWIQTMAFSSTTGGLLNVSAGVTDWQVCLPDYTSCGIFPERYGETGYIYAPSVQSSSIIAKGGDTTMRAYDGDDAGGKHAGGTGAGGRILLNIVEIPNPPEVNRNPGNVHVEVTWPELGGQKVEMDAWLRDLR